MAFQPYRVLVVDDEEIVRSMLGKMLGANGYRYLLASSGREAREILSREPVDLVIMDILMPEESGIELCKAIRQQYPRVAILILSAVDGPETVGEAISAGADGYLTKPTEPKELLAQITVAMYYRKQELATEGYKKELEATIQEKNKSLQEMLEKVAENERFFNSILDSIQEGIIVLSPDLTIEWTNSALKKWFGNSEPLLGRKCYEVVYKRAAPCKYCSAIMSLNSKKPSQKIYKLTPRSQMEWIRSLAYPMIGESGEVSKIVVVVSDITQFKRTEESLRKSEELYRSLVESITDAIVRLDLERRIVSCNRAFLDIFGYEEDEVIGESISLCHPSEESFHSFDEQVYPEIKRKGCARSEWNFVTKKGKVIPFETTTSAIKDPSGNTIGYVSVMRDITERRSAQQALEESEKKYRLLVENIREGIVVGQGSMLKFVNDAICKISGYSRDELLKMPWKELVHPDDRLRIEKIHKARLAGEMVPKTYTFRLIDKKGRIRWLENSGVVITWEGELASLNFLTDITKRKQVEDELRAAHSDLEHLVSSLSSILIELTSDGIVRRWNKVAEEILGLKENQVLSRKLSHLGLAWEIEKILDGLDRCKNTKRPVRLGDIPFVRQDKKRVLLGITINPKTNNTGDLLGFILVGADITEHRVMEAQLLQAQKLESVGQLAAGIAHEINTPIQFVGDNIQFLHEAFADLMRLLEAYKKLYDKQGNCEGLAPRLQEARELEEAIDLPFLAKEVPKAIEQSMEGVRRVAKIVGAMKEFSYPDVEEKTPIDLNHAIENTVIVAKNEWKYVAELITDLDPNLPPVPCLPGEFNQVILNLIINAAHAISDVVKEQEGKKGKITITTRRIEDWVEIRVSDTGTGIPEEIRDRIFDPFFTTKEVGKGTGQGLAIARSMLVNKHKGSIEFETEVGKGTTFIVRLPLKEKG